MLVYACSRLLVLEATTVGWLTYGQIPHVPIGVSAPLGPPQLKSLDTPLQNATLHYTAVLAFHSHPWLQNIPGLLFSMTELQTLWIPSWSPTKILTIVTNIGKPPAGKTVIELLAHAEGCHSNHEWWLGNCCEAFTLCQFTARRPTAANTGVTTSCQAGRWIGHPCLARVKLCTSYWRQ